MLSDEKHCRQHMQNFFLSLSANQPFLCPIDGVITQSCTYAILFYAQDQPDVHLIAQTDCDSEQYNGKGFKLEIECRSGYDDEI